jgi:hypothetical protein
MIAVSTMPKTGNEISVFHRLKIMPIVAPTGWRFRKDRADKNHPKTVFMIIAIPKMTAPARVVNFVSWIPPHGPIVANSERPSRSTVGKQQNNRLESI